VLSVRISQPVYFGTLPDSPRTVPLVPNVSVEATVTNTFTEPKTMRKGRMTITQSGEESVRDEIDSRVEEALQGDESRILRLQQIHAITNTNYDVLFDLLTRLIFGISGETSLAKSEVSSVSIRGNVHVILNTKKIP
jgi:hypothetical protein